MTPQNKPKCTCEIFWDIGKWKGRKLSKTCPIHKKEYNAFKKEHPILSTLFRL